MVPRSIVFKQVASQLRRVGNRELRINFKFDVEDFSIDPSQDLLLATCVISAFPTSIHINDFLIICRHDMIHLLSLSTGKTHPLAALPIICGIEYDDNVAGAPSECSFGIRISSRFIGILFILIEGGLDLEGL